MKKHALFLVSLILLVLIIKLKQPSFLQEPGVLDIKRDPSSIFFAVQSIDTMKYSRDIAREKLNDKLFDSVINEQVRLIAQTGATHVAIATPYDREFLPFLKRWVKAARENYLNVWFRGNFSGWEGWFNYPKIDRDNHKKNIAEFIKNNPEIFEDGDIFTSCPECENGGPGDPRNTKDVSGHRQFLIDEYNLTKQAFREAGRNVSSNYFSMNGDVARLIMDKKTTDELDGIVVIDHYVSSPDQLIFDINDLAKRSEGKIVLGEFGAPIPDIHGKMTEDQQAEWVKIALDRLMNNENVVGVNYWTNTGSSTELWNNRGEEKKVVSVLEQIYRPNIMDGLVTNELEEPIQNAIISGKEHNITTNNNGLFSLLFIDKNQEVHIEKKGYKTAKVSATQTLSQVVLIKEKEDLLFKLKKMMKLLKELIIYEHL